MKTLKNISTLIFFLALSLTICSAQQGEEKQESFSINSIDYMKVHTGMHSDYITLEKAWQKIHQANINAGKYEAWFVSQIMYPTGINEEYNYIVRTRFKDEAQFAEYMGKNPMPENWMSLLTADEVALVNRTSEIRDFVKTELWQTEDYLEPKEESPITVFNFFSVPRNKPRSAHFKVEQDIWRPMHQAKINDDIMEGWVMASKVLPYGTDIKYSVATVDLYKSMNQYFKESDVNYFKKIHPDKTIKEIMTMTRETGELLRSEIRKNVLRSLKTN